jgi:hypothetical protein
VEIRRPDGVYPDDRKSNKEGGRVTTSLLTEMIEIMEAVPLAQSPIEELKSVR